VVDVDVKADVLLLVLDVSVEFVFEKEVAVTLVTDSGEFVANKVVESWVTLFAAFLDVTALSDVGACPFSDELPANVFVSAGVVCGFVNRLEFSCHAILSDMKYVSFHGKDMKRDILRVAT
jgi:hypothetical protein